ncbi:MAG: hypothetical protein JRI85_10965 [Deltaproteobacteria bacterium]|nr:hypothetical protein [Deltaproteobacteria bacterium]
MSVQLDLFDGSASLDPTYEVKRQIRLALKESDLSRDQVADAMNELAAQDGISKRASKATLDSWTKDSDRDRLPSLMWLNYFCEVVGSLSPYIAVIRPLGGRVIGLDEVKLLNWAEAEQEKRQAAKRARLALENLES